MPVTYSARPVTVRRGDRIYNASYRVEDGQVHLDSAYDSASAPVGDRDPKAVAEHLLDRIAAKARH